LNTVTAAAVEYQLRRSGIDPALYAPAEPTRVVAVMARREGPLPAPGNGLLDPSLLTFEGTLQEAGIARSRYHQPELLYSDQAGEIYALKARPRGPAAPRP
jgi:hypothetical protein